MIDLGMAMVHLCTPSHTLGSRRRRLLAPLRQLVVEDRVEKPHHGRDGGTIEIRAGALLAIAAQALTCAPRPAPPAKVNHRASSKQCATTLQAMPQHCSKCNRPILATLVVAADAQRLALRGGHTARAEGKASDLIGGRVDVGQENIHSRQHVHVRRMSADVPNDAAPREDTAIEHRIDGSVHGTLEECFPQW